MIQLREDVSFPVIVPGTVNSIPQKGSRSQVPDGLT